MSKRELQFCFTGSSVLTAVISHWYTKCPSNGNNHTIFQLGTLLFDPLTTHVQPLFFFISRVLHWHPNAGTTVNSQILTEVSQCVESINGVKEGRWKTTLTFYRPLLKGSTNFPSIFISLCINGLVIILCLIHQSKRIPPNSPVIFWGLRFQNNPVNTTLWFGGSTWFLRRILQFRR